MPTNVEAAVKVATGFVNTLYSEKVENPRVEEIERVQENGADAWQITLSFYLPDSIPTQGVFSTLAKLSRIYKVFVVDIASGEVRSMKIRQGTTP